MIWSSCFAPVQMLALDNFVLWVNAKTPYKTAKEYIEAAKKAGPGKMKMGGTGVRSRQLNGTPVASGVVNRFESVMMILCGSPEAFFTSRKPSAPAPPALLIGSSDSFIRLCLATIPWTARAIWSAPPPVPAGMMNSTFLVGSQALATGTWMNDTCLLY